jgi:hypothetical protein
MQPGCTPWGIHCRDGKNMSMTAKRHAMDDRFDVYCGMADNRIGVARLDVPHFLPPGGAADVPEATV